MTFKVVGIKVAHIAVRLIAIEGSNTGVKTHVLIQTMSASIRALTISEWAEVTWPSVAFTTLHSLSFLWENGGNEESLARVGNGLLMHCGVLVEVPTSLKSRSTTGFRADEGSFPSMDADMFNKVKPRSESSSTAGMCTYEPLWSWNCLHRS